MGSGNRGLQCGARIRNGQLNLAGAILKRYQAPAVGHHIPAAGKPGCALPEKTWLAISGHLQRAAVQDTGENRSTPG